MQMIRSKDSKPEMIVRRFLFSKGYRYRLHDKKLPGKPDIVLKKYNTIILVHGCFWHGHSNCDNWKMPETNREYWSRKIGRNLLRDVRNQTELMELGWNVITIWECQLKPKVRSRTLEDLLFELQEIEKFL